MMKTAQITQTWVFSFVLVFLFVHTYGGLLKRSRGNGRLGRTQTWRQICQITSSIQPPNSPAADIFIRQNILALVRQPRWEGRRGAMKRQRLQVNSRLVCEAKSHVAAQTPWPPPPIPHPLCLPSRHGPHNQPYNHTDTHIPSKFNCQP